MKSNDSYFIHINPYTIIHIRPFNGREKERNAELIVKMNGQTTTLMRPSKQRTGNEGEDNKQFSFDHSYWSFSPSDPSYATQDVVFNDLGVEVLKNAWEGMGEGGEQKLRGIRDEAVVEIKEEIRNEGS